MTPGQGACYCKLGLNVSRSAHNCGCVVDGSDATAAVLLLNKLSI